MCSASVYVLQVVLMMPCAYDKILINDQTTDNHYVTKIVFFLNKHACAHMLMTSTCSCIDTVKHGCYVKTTALHMIFFALRSAYCRTLIASKKHNLIHLGEWRLPHLLLFNRCAESMKMFLKCQ